MKYILDTDHASILERKIGPDYAVLTMNLNLHDPDDVGVSVVTFQEQVLGANARIVQAKNPTELLRGYEILFMILEQARQFPLVPFDAAALGMFDAMRAAKVRIGTMDLRIAAVALARNLTVVTRNAADFAKVPGLSIVDWTK